MRIAAIVLLLIASVGTLGIIVDRLPYNELNDDLHRSYYWLTSELLAYLGFLLGLCFLVHVFRQRRLPSSRLAWVLLILFLPYVGVPLYLVFQNRKMRRRARRLVILVLPKLGVPLGMILGVRKMRRLARWRERTNQPAIATRQRS
jgi:hypothetical protein